ncbi:MAG TPA: class I SAM-dependent methyltransferase [Bryobacterales bacterium]|nr:class I SAM-dependent methyltransferase [Bryobacterales bacterium]
MATPTASPTPERIWDSFMGYQRTAAVKAAIELDVFTAIGEGATTAPALAGRCQASERGLRILCDFLVVAGLLTKDGNRYGLAPDAAVFLDRRSPASWAGVVKFILSPMLTSAFNDLAAAVRKGGTVMGPDGTVGRENELWVEFARSMVPMMMPAAEQIAALTGASEGQPWKVLDVAAGHGMFGITLARHNPNAEIVALDWASVLAVALEHANVAGVAGRYRTLPGSAFEVDFGSGYDLVLLTNFLHHFDVPACEGFLRKVCQALRPGGRAVTLEFVPNDDRVSPPPAATFSMMMLGTTPSGDAYTFAELDRMFRNAGFARSEIHALERSPENVIISYR